MFSPSPAPGYRSTAPIDTRLDIIGAQIQFTPARDSRRPAPAHGRPLLIPHQDITLPFDSLLSAEDVEITPPPPSETSATFPAFLMSLLPYLQLHPGKSPPQVSRSLPSHSQVACHPSREYIAVLSTHYVFIYSLVYRGDNALKPFAILNKNMQLGALTCMTWAYDQTATLLVASSKGVHICSITIGMGAKEPGAQEFYSSQAPLQEEIATVDIRTVSYPAGLDCITELAPNVEGRIVLGVAASKASKRSSVVLIDTFLNAADVLYSTYNGPNDSQAISQVLWSTPSTAAALQGNDLLILDCYTQSSAPPKIFSLSDQGSTQRMLHSVRITPLPGSSTLLCALSKTRLDTSGLFPLYIEHALVGAAEGEASGVRLVKKSPFKLKHEQSRITG